MNGITPDEKSVITGFGKHARVVAFHPNEKNELYIRVDLPAKIKEKDPSYPDLPEPTTLEILTVARKDQGLMGTLGTTLPPSIG